MVVGVHERAVRRYGAKHPEFRSLLEGARELAEPGAAQAAHALLTVAPSPAVEPEVIRAPARGARGQSAPVGLDDLDRIARQRVEHPGTTSVTFGICFDYLERRARDLVGLEVPAVEPGIEPGIDEDVAHAVRVSIMGPAPEADEVDDDGEAVA